MASCGIWTNGKHGAIRRKLERSSSPSRRLILRCSISDAAAWSCSISWIRLVSGGPSSPKNSLWRRWSASKSFWVSGGNTGGRLIENSESSNIGELFLLGVVDDFLGVYQQGDFAKSSRKWNYSMTYVLRVRIGRALDRTTQSLLLCSHLWHTSCPLLKMHRLLLALQASHARAFLNFDAVPLSDIVVPPESITELQTLIFGNYQVYSPDVHIHIRGLGMDLAGCTSCADVRMFGYT